ncbi:transport and Golgi organization protein 1 homolog [Ailuropoda melanoleuca]|uniref:transport and Golgi organization protein 1 homolog n=1 Tax=Ailuropoda melanoleuca TaxID=9646 RepID=UPI001494F1C5|nr:transport and Golgi organization protein 1 homolog [Ailuropoda melanoleuca]
MADAEENLKVIKEETDKYKQQIGEMQDQLQEAELTFKHKIAVYEKNAAKNWMKARVWEQKIQQQIRENAYMIHRLHMMKGEMLPEGCMTQEAMRGRPEMWSPPWRDAPRQQGTCPCVRWSSHPSPDCRPAPSPPPTEEMSLEESWAATSLPP